MKSDSPRGAHLRGSGLVAEGLELAAGLQLQLLHPQQLHQRHLPHDSEPPLNVPQLKALVA
jgi:hypothetical protein